jgi:hypothetical protein
MGALVQRGVSFGIPLFCPVTASGQNRRPAASSLFCFDCVARWVKVSARNLFSQSTTERFLRSLRKCKASASGAGPTRLAPPGVTRAGCGKFNKTETKSCTRTKSNSSDFSAAMQKFATPTTAASPLSHSLLSRHMRTKRPGSAVPTLRMKPPERANNTADSTRLCPVRRVPFHLEKAGRLNSDCGQY